MTKSSSDDSIETSEGIPETSHSSAISISFKSICTLLMRPVNYAKTIINNNDSNEIQEMTDVATLPTQENATGIYWLFSLPCYLPYHF